MKITMYITTRFTGKSIIAVLLFYVIANAVFPAIAASYSPLLISVKEAIEIKKENPRTLLVDVRGEESFKKIHIPDSINVPLHFIKTKDYLRNMHVILVNRGYGQNRLLHQAELLNKKGFEIVVLSGGLAAWSQQGGKLTGSDFAGESVLHNVDPAAFSEKDFSRYIDISPGETAGNSGLLSRAEHLPVISSHDLSALAAVIDQAGQSPLASVLLFNRNGAYSLLEGLLDECQTTIFFLQDGSEGYDKVLLQQQAILEPKSERMKTIGGCETCPSIKDTAGEKNAGESKW
jgi:rhodanese-related sulfurtransferase